MKYAFIRSQRGFHSLQRLCDVLKVSCSGFYDWLDRPESTRTRDNRRLVTKMRCFHRASRSTYGSPRIHRDLQESGETVGIKRVARLMRDAGIQSKMARKFVITTGSKNTLSAAQDQLKRCFTVTGQNKAWVSDTTFIATRQGWLYLAVVMDLFSRQVIGWSMGDKNNSQLVEDALTMSIWRRGQVQDVIVHSDQGSTIATSLHSLAIGL